MTAPPPGRGGYHALPPASAGDAPGTLEAAIARLEPALAAAQGLMERQAPTRVATALRPKPGPKLAPELAPELAPPAADDSIEVLTLDGAVRLVAAAGALPVAPPGADARPPAFWLRHAPAEAEPAFAAARAGQAAQFHATAQNRNGRPATWLVTVTPLRSPAGVLDGILVVSRDEHANTTERGALRDALERLDLALHAGPVIGTWTWDLRTDQVYGDARLARAFSIDPARAALGLTLDTFLAQIHPDDRHWVATSIARTTREGGLFQAEYRLGLPGGAVRWVAASGRCEMDAAGQPLRFPGVLIDVQDRVKSAASLQAKAERQLALLTLGDQLRDARDPATIASLATSLVGRLLGVSNVGYSEIDLARGQSVVRRDWTDGAAASLAGTHNLAAFSKAVERLKQGVPTVEEDLATAAWLGPVEVASYRAINLRALVSLPLLRDGRLVGTMFAGSPVPRAWTQDEVRFVHDVADRTWAAIERVQAEEAVAASAAELRLIADAMPAMIALIDRAQIYRFVNRASLDWLGQPPDAIIGRAVSDVHSAGTLAWRLPSIDRALAGEAVTIEAEWPHCDGRARFAEIRCLPRRDAFGQQDGFYAFVLDITERKRTEQILQGSAEVLEAQVARRSADLERMWRLSTDLMLATNFDSVIFAVNPAWTGLLGWTEAELVGANILDFLHPDDAAAARIEVQRLIAGVPLQRFDTRCRHRDGSWRWVSWSAAADERLIHAAGRNITAEREHQALQLQLEEQLRQSQKMEAVGQLTGGLAHDFNNLLTGITGSLELLQTRVAQGRVEKLDRYIHTAQGAASRAAALTHRLLAFSRRQTLDPKPTSLNALVNDMKELIQRTAGPAIHVDTALCGTLWPTLCDPNQLENALLNLCINARDAMPDGGRLTIATVNAEVDAAAGQAQDMTPGAYVVMSVTDTGVGMAPEIVARAFDPFFTTKPIGEGTGLGLSMIYGFARQSGGQVRIESAPDRGTTMRLYLPRHATNPAPETAAPAVTAPRAKQGETVLVVEDEPSVRDLVLEVLEELGYAAIAAADGVEGLALLNCGRRVDLLITDVGLPGGMNGRQLADAARLGRPALKTLFITGYAAHAFIGHSNLPPAMHVMAKPFTMDGLAVKIRDILAGGS